MAEIALAVWNIVVVLCTVILTGGPPQPVASPPDPVECHAEAPPEESD